MRVSISNQTLLILLKKGYCYAKLGNSAKAIEVFDSLKDTILEPYALAERAMMELPNNTEYEAFRKDGDYKQAYLSFKTLLVLNSSAKSLIKLWASGVGTFSKNPVSS